MAKWKKGVRFIPWYPSKSSSKKYSSENYTFTTEIRSNNDNSLKGYGTLIDTTSGNVLGTRKVKNLTLKLGLSQTYSFTDPTKIISFVDQNSPVFWALVFVPEGNNPSNLNVNTFLPNSTSLYEPNQNVIMSGVTCSGESKVYSTKLARNLNYGDRIMLVYAAPQMRAIHVNEGGSDVVIDTGLQLYGEISYAICFN